MDQLHRSDLVTPSKRLKERSATHKPRKLIIQIPCYNEESVLAQTLAQLPRSIVGVDTVEWLVVNDGSEDHSIDIARRAGVDHILELPGHVGLARAFMAGLQHAVDLGADIIVNTDADNQYDASLIPVLIAPILAGHADFVVGDRPISHIEQFSRTKRFLQRLGSQVVRYVSHANINDAPSGFRALSREAALRMNVYGRYTYTLETIIQAGLSGIRTASVPIEVNAAMRPSRLVRSSWDYIVRSVATIARVLLIYQPGRVFLWLGLPPAVAGMLLIARWLWLHWAGIGSTHAPSVSVAAMLMLLGILAWGAGLLGELFAINRRLLQDIQYMLRRDHADRSRLIGDPPKDGTS